jgi:hypothetical protein
MALKSDIFISPLQKKECPRTRSAGIRSQNKNRSYANRIGAAHLFLACENIALSEPPGNKLFQLARSAHLTSDYNKRELNNEAIKPDCDKIAAAQGPTGSVNL